jgi:hypothetical protein
MPISKIETYLSDKCPPPPKKKEVEIKKPKIRIRFFNFNFWGGILLLRQVCFFEISIKFSIFYTLYDLFQEKKSHLRRAVFQMF